MTAGAEKRTGWTLLPSLRHFYARGFFLAVLARLFVVTALVEAIYLAERFQSVFNGAYAKDASLLDITALLACASTEILDVTLAIALLVAVYWTLIRLREDRELLVLFAAGQGAYQLLGLIMVLAVAAQLASLTISGLVDPMSRYAQRSILFNAEFRALKHGISTGQFYFFPDHVAFTPAPSQEKGNAASIYGRSKIRSRRLFLYEQGSDTFRIVTADRARLVGPDSAGRVFLELGGFNSRAFAAAQGRPGGRAAQSCDSCGVEMPGDLRVAMQVRNATEEMTVDELLPFLPRGSELEERTIFDELGMTERAPARRLEATRQLSERLARSLLCLLAPLIALAAVGLTFRASNYIVLPLACMALMSLNLASDWLIWTMAPLGPLTALAATAGLTLLLGLALLWLVLRFEGELARPQLVRA